MLTLDGSHGEGGGALLRVALGLSTVTGRPFRMTRIRAGRPTPGLKHEHLHAIRILQALTGAKAEDVHLGSEEVLFVPGTLRRRRLVHDLETAASTTLVASCVALATLFSGQRVRVTLRGGTDVAWSPPAAYFSHVACPMLAPLGDVSFSVARRGYYPKGGGEATLTVEGNEQRPPLDYTTRGELLAIMGVSHASASLDSVAERQARAASAALDAETLDVQPSYSATGSPGSSITLWARCEHSTLGASALGERGVRAEIVGSRAAKALAALLETEAAVDPHMADQLVPYLALVGGAIRTSEVTPHTEANIWLAQQFTDASFIVRDAFITCVTEAGQSQ